MRHTAWIYTAGDDSGARFAAPFLLPALQSAARACCDEVRETNGESVCRDGVALMLSVQMPLITEADMRALMDAAEACGGVAVAAGAQGQYPRCVAGESGEVCEVPLSEEALFVAEEPETFARALSVLRARKRLSLMRSGVWLIDPERTYIDDTVMVGEETVIYPGCVISGDTVIGRGCTLLPNSRIVDSRIGDGAKIESSVLLSCEVGRRTSIGPFAYVRPGTVIGDDCRIGDFVEIKNSAVGDGTKVSHLSYVGDSELGKHINIGCGVVFVNYDGKQKHRSTVGDGAFIGCNVNLVSPVRVGEGAYVAAGSTVTEDVPGEALAIARARQTTKPGWATERRTKGKL